MTVVPAGTPAVSGDLQFQDHRDYKLVNCAHFGVPQIPEIARNLWNPMASRLSHLCRWQP